MNLVAFEAINNVRLEVRLSTADYHGRGDVAIAMLAHSREGEIGDLPPLGSVSVRCSALNLVSLDAALIHVMYLLDGKLARGEFVAALNK